MERLKGHELWEELWAFDPNWQHHYDTTEDAAIAAGVHEVWREYCRDFPRRNSLACQPKQVPNAVAINRAARSDYEREIEQLNYARSRGLI